MVIVTTLAERMAVTMGGRGANVAVPHAPAPTVTRQEALLMLPPPAASVGATVRGPVTVPPPLTASTPACAYVNVVAVGCDATVNVPLKLVLATPLIVTTVPGAN